MSTRSSIAVQGSDGKISAVYCHFDGYLNGVGETLVLKYDNSSLAEALVGLGNLSCVSQKEVIAYSRDRGERMDENKPLVYENFDKYMCNVNNDIDNNGFHYVFMRGEWYVHGDGLRSQSPRQLILVESALGQDLDN